jgi:hypothetical protein
MGMLTVNDVLDGRVGLDIECMDRIYLNGYVPGLQVGGQVAGFMTGHLGLPIPSPAIMEKIGTAFRRAVQDFAATNHIPVVRFGKDDRKIEVMRGYLAGQARTDRAGVAAIGVAQEYQNVFASAQRSTGNAVWFSFYKADRRVTCFYGTTTSGRRSSRSVPTFPTRSRSGSTGTSGLNARLSGRGSGSANCPTGSPPAPILTGCRRSATGSARAPSKCSSSVG